MSPTAPRDHSFDLAETSWHSVLTALGHPLGASGARITANLVHNLHRLNKRYAVGAACIGGGQGIAIVLERA